MHTFEGMVGYCLKEQDEVHFRKVMHNVTVADVNKGVELYSFYGADELKNRVCLTPINIFDRALMFWKFKLRHPQRDVHNPSTGGLVPISLARKIKPVASNCLVEDGAA
ncbi:hypothetical protein GOP47_0008245 [Adiantum capillus-veneris]|uniref:Replitron HUH endonuclease domain-containing protein n=1 Tax=Adiantum capillus-veneris TaxID=13818 RepID=A0A9D4ZKH5_ADICA|nr:hypothetical protein GOP47_0008245 [Adiantum capillus-veneris]